MRGTPFADHSIKPCLSNSSNSFGSERQCRPMGGFIPLNSPPVTPFLVSPGAWSGIVVYKRPFLYKFFISSSENGSQGSCQIAFFDFV